MTNQSSGRISFNGKAGNNPGAEGTTFVNLVNEGIIDVTVESVLFTKGLNNSGTLNISSGSTGTRFKDMIDADGNIRFINSGVLNINASSSDDSFGTKEYRDLHNTGTVNIAAAVNFGKVINESTITVTNSGTLKFYGALTNNGTISGPGFVEIF